MRLIWLGSDPGQDAARVLVLIARIRGSTKGGEDASSAAADVITGGITRNQYARRKDDRKGRMDPMSRSS